MFGLRFNTDCTPRTKNGQPAHSTTGADRTSSTQLCVPIGNSPRRWPNMASKVTMTVRGRVHQNRRVKSRNSGLSSSASSVGSIGSSVMPHLGQLPGIGCWISGCIGQV